MKNTSFEYQSQLEKISIQNIYKELVLCKFWLLTGALIGLAGGSLFYLYMPSQYVSEIYIAGGYISNEEYPNQKLVTMKLHDPAFQATIINSSNINELFDKDFFFKEILSSSTFVNQSNRIKLVAQGENKTDNDLILNSLGNSIVNYQNNLIDEKIEHIKKKIAIKNEFLNSINNYDLFKGNDFAAQTKNHIKNTREEILILSREIQNSEYIKSHLIDKNNSSKLISPQLSLCILRGIFFGMLIGYLSRVFFFKLKK